VIHRDAALLVVDKSAGVVVEPGLHHARDSLLNGLMAIVSKELVALGERRDWGLLHRLDRETSGCLVVALDAPTYDALRSQFEARSILKDYLAVVQGRLLRPHGEIQIPLVEVVRDGMKISVPGRRGAGRSAVTRWSVLSHGSGRSLLRVSITTGRLHQIRAHMALIGNPVVGDRIYRSDLPPNTSKAPRGRPAAPLLLHAWRLGFEHPVTGQRVEFLSPAPERMVAGAIEAGIAHRAAFEEALRRKCEDPISRRSGYPLNIHEGADFPSNRRDRLDDGRRGRHRRLP